MHLLARANGGGRTEHRRIGSSRLRHYDFSLLLRYRAINVLVELS
jgi:hypothetical protein